MTRVPLVVLTALLSACSRSAGPPQSTAPRTGVMKTGQGRLISAFFGLDHALPRQADFICRGAARQDGMPVILSTTIDSRTLDREDFVVITRAGLERTPSCVTLAPAIGPGELRTVLLVGDLGSAADPPVRVRVVGDILSDGATGQVVNFHGAELRVTPLEEGPTIVWAEEVPKDQWSGGGRSGGTPCPAGTVQVVRVVWSGGVRLPNGDEAGDAERALYRVTMRSTDGLATEVVPFALADLDDNDNNHSLCLDVVGAPLSVSFPAGHLVDPRGDLNPNTETEVRR